MATDIQVRFSSAELTDAGKKQELNEDATFSLPEYGVFSVADGMGGTLNDETAAGMALQLLGRKLKSADPGSTLEELTRVTSRALDEASYWIKERSEERAGAAMASTVAVLILDRMVPGRAAVLHAGDSRVYKLREDKLTLLTADHSIAAVAGIADEKDLPPMLRGVITNAVGTKEQVHLDNTPVDVREGDTFLLCTDGLPRMLSADELEKLLNHGRDQSLTQNVEALVQSANAAGGEDNVSVILVHIDFCKTSDLDAAEEEPLTDMTSSAAIGESDEYMVPSATGTTDARLTEESK